MLQPSGKSNGFVIAITEATAKTPQPIPTSNELSLATNRTRRPRPQPPPLTIPSKAHIADDHRQITPPTRQSPPSTNGRAPSAADVPLPRSSLSTPTLARRGSSASPPVCTPAMRSMFPKYDPSVPLAHQQYYPDMRSVPGLASAMAVAGSSSNRPSEHSQNITQIAGLTTKCPLGGTQEAAVVKESPFRPQDDSELAATLSGPEELPDLWDIANGQTSPEGAIDTFTLELSCDDLALGREVITFNSSTSNAVYTLEASNNDLTFARTHPVNRNPTIQISSSILSQPTSAEPLVTTIFPKLAGLMALDQSSNVAVAHKLDRKASADLQIEAINRAQEREASMLLWDNESNQYCLMHPTLLDSSVTILPIEVSPKPSHPQQIKILAPETNTPLLTLSLTSLALKVHTSPIIALPSLYILDTLMISLLSLLLHLHRSCVAPGSYPASTTPQTPHFPPPPTLAYKGSQASLRKHRSLSRVSIFRSNKSMKSTKSLHSASVYDEDIEMQSLPHVSTAADVVGVKKRQPPKQLFATDDENLPKVTRTVLKLLYWVFELVFWIMSVTVQVLAAGIVGAGKLITKL